MKYTTISFVLALLMLSAWPRPGGAAELDLRTTVSGGFFDVAWSAYGSVGSSIDIGVRLAETHVLSGRARFGVLPDRVGDGGFQIPGAHWEMVLGSGYRAVLLPDSAVSPSIGLGVGIAIASVSQTGTDGMVPFYGFEFTPEFGVEIELSEALDLTIGVEGRILIPFIPPVRVAFSPVGFVGLVY